MKYSYEVSSIGIRYLLESLSNPYWIPIGLQTSQQLESFPKCLNPRLASRLHVDSLGFTWIHLDPLGLIRTLLKLTRTHPPEPKGKRERGTVCLFFPNSDLATRPRVCACNRIETISRLVSLPQPPIFQIVYSRFCISRIIFQVFYSRFYTPSSLFQVLDSKVYIPSLYSKMYTLGDPEQTRPSGRSWDSPGSRRTWLASTGHLRFKKLSKNPPGKPG